ncbi:MULTISPECIES: LuxR C-terminal-related transcriptional regulator [Brenneria]|nr:regulatory protein LuxR [Brenneria sp. EniD312]
MDVRIFSKCHFTIVGLREALSHSPMLYVRPAYRFTLPHARTSGVFIIDGGSEGFEEYYESVRTSFYKTALLFIIINNSPYHLPVCIDKKTMLISKSSPMDFFYKLPDFIPSQNSHLLNPVRLSKSEQTVFQYWTSGYTAESISEIIGLNKKSVLNSKSRLLNKYGVQDKNSLLLIAKILFKDTIAKQSSHLSESTKNITVMGSLAFR